MDLPPSGWYPDPYGVPGLLRWWDGSAWTEHTHQDGTDATDDAGPATSVQSTTVQPAVQPTAVQPAVQPTAVQPTTVQPTRVQPPAYQPAAARSASARSASAQPPSEADASGTQVLFLGDDAWSTLGGPGPGPGPAAQASRYGYYRAQRRRRMWLMGGLAGGTAAALGVIALVVTSLSKSPATPAAATSPTTPAAHTTSAPPPSSSPSPTPSATASGSQLTDSQSGMSYAQLSAPWQPTCPAGLNNGQFTWTAGESAIAGQVNGNQTTWYGVACSGPLPSQYGYNGVADLENTATNLVNTFNGAYYNALQHNFQQEVSQPVQVSGHAGWEIKFLMTYTNVQGQGLSWNDEQGAVVVADLGTGVPPAVFYTSVPGNLGENNVDSLVSSLQVSAPLQPSGSPGDGGSPAAGSPAPGDGNNGNGNGHGNNP
jgi:hypothetical protein